MSELKNLIVVDITDNENIILAPTSIGATNEHNIKEIKAKGTLLIKNASQKSRLWNITCDLKEIVNTNLKKVLNAGAINPDQAFKQEYEIQNLKNPCLKLIETFDAERDISGKINNAFLYENTNKCNLKFDLSNTINVPVTEITLKKEIPEILQDIEIKNPNFGSAELGEEEGKKVLLWKIENLPAKETAMLEVYCVVHVKERKDQSLGNLKVNYLIENHKLTMVEPEVRGLTDSMSGVTREEGSNPATWDCNVEFLNDSEFKVKLESVKVTHKIPTGTEDVVSEAPDIELNPDQSWDKNFPIESQNVPELESEIEFTTLFGVITRVIGEINKEPTYYHVLSAEISKSINPAEVAAYANTDMIITNTIPNLGTANIGTLEIIDEIPKDFIPPMINDIKVELINQEGTYEIQGRTEYTESIDLNPEDQNPESKHSISVKLKDLEKQMTSSAQIKISYPLLAKNPKPEVRYNTPVEIRANVPVKGKEFIISPPEEPVLKVKYVARKLKTLKSVKPGLSGGEFSISVRIQNSGDVELENIVVKDKIPSGFTLSEFTPPSDTTHEVLKLGVESELHVKIPKINGGNSISINYNCSGSGDYPRSEPSVLVLGREGVAGAEETVKTSKSIEAGASGADKSKQAKVHDLFSLFFNKIEAGTNSIQLAALIEDNKDKLPAGSAMHQLIQYAKELKGHGDKAIVGGFKEGIIAKLNEIKKIYG